MQTALVGTRVTDSLVVKLSDPFGNPVAGTTVHWAAATSGTQVNPTDQVTNAEGLAATQVTLRTTSGSNTVTAAVSGLPSVNFRATGIAGDAATIEASGLTSKSGVVGSTVTLSVKALDEYGNAAGDAQSAQVPVALPESLVVRAIDQYGNLVPGASVSWDGGSLGSISPVNTTTDAQGLARAQWTLSKAGQASATARDIASGRSAIFTATGTPATSPALIIVSGNGQTDVAGEYLQDLVVQLNDANGQPIAGAPVSWAGSTLDYPISASGYTSSTGTASAHVKLPVSMGPVTVTAKSGSATPAVFSATAVAGPWCSSHIVLNGPSTAPAGGTLTVWQRSTDWAGNPASQTTVGDRLTLSDGGTVAWRDSIPGLRIGTWTLGSTIGTQTLSYHYTFCGGFSPKSGFPRSGSDYEVINVTVVAPSP